jgi:hypothetical protein
LLLLLLLMMMVMMMMMEYKNLSPRKMADDDGFHSTGSVLHRNCSTWAQQILEGEGNVKF